MVLAHCNIQRGRVSPSGIILTVVRRSIFSGIFGLPQSRPCEKLQSVVTISPTAPAARARSTLAAIASRPPSQYTWKNSFGLAAMTSSIGLLANDDSPIAVPRAAAARATATSPSGWTACTPVGEISTGSEISCPITVVAQITLLRRTDDVRGEAELTERLDVVGDGQPLLAGGDQRAVDGLGQPLLRALLGDGDGFEPDVAGHDQTGLSLQNFFGGAARPATLDGGNGEELERDRSLAALRCGSGRPLGLGLSRSRASAGSP